MENIASSPAMLRLAEHLKFPGFRRVSLWIRGDILEIDSKGARKAGRVTVGRGLHRFGSWMTWVQDMVDPRPPSVVGGWNCAADHRNQPAHGPAGSTPEIVCRGFNWPPMHLSSLPAKLVTKTLEGSNDLRRKPIGA